MAANRALQDPGKIEDLAHDAVIMLVIDQLRLPEEGDDGQLTANTLMSIGVADFEDLAAAIWPIRVAKGAGLRLSLPQMRWIASLHASSPESAMRVAEFFNDRGVSDPAAWVEYLANGTVLADGVL